MIAQQFAMNPMTTTNVQHTNSIMKGYPNYFFILVLHFKNVMSATKTTKKGGNKQEASQWCKFHGHADRKEEKACFRERMDELEALNIMKRKGDVMALEDMEAGLSHQNRIMGYVRSKGLTSKKLSSIKWDADGFITSVDGVKLED